MLINISELISTPLKSETFEVPVTMEFYELSGDRFPFREKGSLLLTVANTGSRKLHLNGRWQGTIGIPCDRCLEEVEVPFDLSIVQKLVAPDRADQDALEEQEAFMEGYSLNIDSLIDNEITTS